MRFLRAFGAVTLVLGVAHRPALANGRFPEEQRLLEHPSDPNRLYLSATYGLLLSEDRGQNWYYVCESSFALAYLEGDPLLEVLPDGKLVAGIHESLNLSSDCGCSWQPTLAEPTLENVIDVTLGSDEKLVALVQDLTTPPGRHVLFESADHGTTWQKLSDLPTDLPNLYTVDVAPSDPSRLYATGISSALPTGYLLVSENRGQTWAERPIEGTSPSVQPYIAAVSATDPDVVYVRTNHWDEMTDIAAQDSLLVTADGGGTFREILHREAKLFGFALSPDGRTVVAGYGDPNIAGRSTNIDDWGIYKASTTDFVFERISDEAISCLRWTPTGLYVCVSDFPGVPSPDLALGFAPNADFTLADENPLTALLDTKNVKGPLACTGDVCAETWSAGLEGNVSVCQALAAECDGDFSTNALSCPMGPGGNGGAGGQGGTTATGGTDATGGASGSTSTGGASGSTSTGGTGALGGGGPVGGSGGNATSGTDSGGTSSGDEGGCGCRERGKSSSGMSGVSLTALAVMIAARRARSRRRRAR